MERIFHDAYVVIFLVAVYGLAVALGGWYLMPAERRHHFRGRLQFLFAGANRLFAGNLFRVTKKISSLPPGFSARTTQLISATTRHRRAAIISVALLVVPAVIAQLLAARIALEAYDDLPPATDPVIAALLQGERLVAPVPLPPVLFLTREVESEREDIATASREWGMLDDDFRQRLLAIFEMMARHGYQMVLLEGYRSPQRQAALAKLGAHVTNAGAYQSYHQYGLAADSAFLRDGKIVISEKDSWAMEGYRLYGQYAESAGLVWGGRWQMMDFGHVELRKPGILARR